jgi:DNA-binding NarL/FixJ family response regulator
MGQCTRVLIADDHAHSRKGLRALLSTWPAVEVVGEAEDGREAVQRVEECQPDVVLMDLQMPEWDGLKATRYIKARWPQIRVIALTIRATSRSEAMAAGVDAFLLKGCPSKELLAAIQGDEDSREKSKAAMARTEDTVTDITGVNPLRNPLTAAASMA